MISRYQDTSKKRSGKMALKQTTIRLEADLLREIKFICLKKDTSLQEVTTQLLAKWVEENRNDNGA
jgi:hypothetical protein